MLVSLVMTLAIACPQQTPAGTPVSKPQFIALMRELHSKPVSISYRFEGEEIDLNDDGSQEPPEKQSRFHGSYTLQGVAHPAGILELTVTSGSKPPYHASYTTLKGQVDTSEADTLTIDPKSLKMVPRRGDISFLFEPLSPQRYVFTAFFRSMFDDASFFYEYLGWEKVGETLCLKVKLGSVPGDTKPYLPQVVWFDLARGGHALRIQEFHKETKLTETMITRVAKLKSSKGEIWLPVEETTDMFASIKSPPREKPFRRLVTTVVGSSILIDEKFPDSHFVPHNKRPGSGNKTGQILQSHATEPKSQPRFVKTDLASVERRLEENLQTAAQQKEELKASSPADEWFFSNLFWQVILIIPAITLGAYAIRIGLRRTKTT